MRAPIFPSLGPALVLYLIAAVAASASRLISAVWATSPRESPSAANPPIIASTPAAMNGTRSFAFSFWSMRSRGTRLMSLAPPTPSPCKPSPIATVRLWILSCTSEGSMLRERPIRVGVSTLWVANCSCCSKNFLMFSSLLPLPIITNWLMFASACWLL